MKLLYFHEMSKYSPDFTRFDRFCHTWLSKLSLNGQFWRKFHLISANSSHPIVGLLWSGTSTTMGNLLKAHHHVLYEIPTHLSQKIIFIQPKFLKLSPLWVPLGPPWKRSASETFPVKTPILPIWSEPVGCYQRNSWLTVHIWWSFLNL